MERHSQRMPEVKNLQNEKCTSSTTVEQIKISWKTEVARKGQEITNNYQLCLLLTKIKKCTKKRKSSGIISILGVINDFNNTSFLYYLRSTMSQERSTNLLLISTEKLLNDIVIILIREPDKTLHVHVPLTQTKMDLHALAYRQSIAKEGT